MNKRLFIPLGVASLSFLKHFGRKGSSARRFPIEVKFLSTGSIRIVISFSSPYSISYWSSKKVKQERYGNVTEKDKVYQRFWNWEMSYLEHAIAKILVSGFVDDNGFSFKEYLFNILRQYGLNPTSIVGRSIFSSYPIVGSGDGINNADYETIDDRYRFKHIVPYVNKVEDLFEREGFSPNNRPLRTVKSFDVAISVDYNRFADTKLDDKGRIRYDSGLNAEYMKMVEGSILYRLEEISRLAVDYVRSFNISNHPIFSDNSILNTEYLSSVWIGESIYHDYRSRRFCPEGYINNGLGTYRVTTGREGGLFNLFDEIKKKRGSVRSLSRYWDDFILGILSTSCWYSLNGLAQDRVFADRLNSSRGWDVRTERGYYWVSNDRVVAPFSKYIITGEKESTKLRLR